MGFRDMLLALEPVSALHTSFKVFFVQSSKAIHPGILRRLGGCGFVLNFGLGSSCLACFLSICARGFVACKASWQLRLQRAWL